MTSKVATIIPKYFLNTSETSCKKYIHVVNIEIAFVDVTKDVLENWFVHAVW